MIPPVKTNASVVDRVKPVEAGVQVVAAAFLGARPVLALADGRILFADDGTAIGAHDGAILVVSCDGERLLTGGDDGRLVETTATGAMREIFAAPGGAWIDTVALGPSGSFAWSAGKTVFAQTGKGEPKQWTAPSTPGGLAFAPKGLRLAVAHYGGVSLWFPNAATAPDFLAWKGSHHLVTWSPDGRFVVSAMQEPQLHGWRVADGANMRMSGYPGKVRSMSWTANGNGLATAGADTLIVWPFAGKDGPMGKQPAMFAPNKARISVVACHPENEIVAVGYADGLILLVRLSDGAEILVRKPDETAVSALAFARTGTTLLFGTEAGGAGLLAL